MHLKSNAPLREQLAVCRSVPEFRSVVLELEQKYRPYHDGQLQWNGEEQDEPAEEQQQEDLQEPPDCNLRLPPWLCQPYVRIPPEAHRQKLAEARRLAEDPTREKRQFFDVHGNEISRKRMKKMRRVQRRPKNRNRNDPKQSPTQQRAQYSENEDEEQATQLTVSVSERDGRRRRRFDELCKNDTHCTNPMGLKCDHRLCKTCCKSKCYREDRDCPGHKIRIKSRRDRARALTLAEQQQQQQQASGEQQMHDERDDNNGEIEMDVKADAADLTTTEKS